SRLRRRPSKSRFDQGASKLDRSILSTSGMSARKSQRICTLVSMRAVVRACGGPWHHGKGKGERGKAERRIHRGDTEDTEAAISGRPYSARFDPPSRAGP